jgi:nitrite reductase (NADH) small subunit
MALVKVARVSDIPPGTLVEVMVNGEPYALCHVEGEFRALGGVCPHRGGPIGQGNLHGGRVVCPWHAWEFDSRTGENDYDPSCRLPVYAVAVQNGDVLIDLP